MALPPFGWKNDRKPSLSAEELEAWGQTVASYFEAGQSPTVVTSVTPQPALLAQVEPYSNPYTVYLDIASGNDSNKGNSPGQAFLTLGAAIAKIQQSQHGGRIIIVGVAAGNVDLAAPVAVVRPLAIEAITPSGVTIRRTFTTASSRSVWDAVTTVSGTSVSSATAAFTNADNARIVAIYGAGSGGGTYYDFINGNPPSGTVANLTATTTIARNATTDPIGVKMSVVGDWNRVVTDASMAQGGSVITSATAAWAAADIGTEVVIAGAGQGGQALRCPIVSVSGNTATVNGVCSAVSGISNARCAIGVNFGTLFTYWGTTGGQSMLRNLVLTDQTGNTNAIGSAIDIQAPDLGAGVSSNPADMVYENCTITSTTAGGSWEHMITCDGSWNQNTSGTGIRRVSFKGMKPFGARRPGETIRLINPVHWEFSGLPGVAAAPTSFAQGVVILDPQNTAGVQVGTEDVNFHGVEGTGWYFYSEGSRTNFYGSIAPSVSISGRPAVWLTSTSKNSTILASLATALTGVNASDRNDGTGNQVQLSNGAKPNISRALDNYAPSTWIAETFSRNEWGVANASQAVGSSGVQLVSLIWLPGGTLISKIGLLTGGTALAWGSGWTGPHFQVGLIGPDGNLVATSADTGGTQVLGSSALTSISMATPARTPYSGLCGIAVLINSGTGGTAFTYPSWGGFANLLANGLAPLLTATNGAGLTAVTGITLPPGSGGQPNRLYALVG